MQNVNSVSLMDSTAAVSVNTNQVSSSQESFQKYMGLQSSQTQNDSGSAVKNTTVETKVSSGVTKVSGETGSAKISSGESQLQDSTGAVADSSVTGSTVGTKDVSFVADQGEVAETAAEIVQDVVGDVLQMDDAALDAIMSEMGISYAQLLQPNVLQEFVLQIHSGSDITQLLTSEEMLGEFTQLTENLEDVDWEALTGMSLEEVTDFLNTEVLQEETVSNRDQSFSQILDAYPIDQEQTDTVPVLQDLSDLEKAEDTVVLDTSSEMTAQVSETVQTSQEISVEENVLPDVVSEGALAEESRVGQKSSEESKVSSFSQENVSVGSQAESVVSLENSSLQSFSDTDSEEAGQQNQSLPQESVFVPETDQTFSQSVTTMADFVENMMEAVSTEQSPETVNMQQMIDIVNQVVEQIHSSMEDGATTLEMQLNPESLGKLLLSVTNKNGVMTASFTVQSTEAKVALESQMITLRENLEQKNLKVEAVEVSVSDFAFSQSGQADTGDSKDFRQGDGRRSRFRFDEEEEETEEDAQVQAARVRQSIMRDQGTSIDFTA
jgi:flagellar hook-length control protein FliK